MNASNLDRRIVIEQNTPTSDEFGEPVEAWATFATVWAARRDRELGARSDVESDQEVSKIKTLWYVRYRTDLTTEMRVTYNGDTFRIEAITDNGHRKEFLILHTLKLSSDG